MTLHIRAIHTAERRQSYDRVIRRLQDSTTETLAEELRPLRWPLPKSNTPRPVTIGSQGSVHLMGIAKDPAEQEPVAIGA